MPRLVAIVLGILLSLSVSAAPLSAAQAAKKAQQQYGGQVLDIKQVRSNNSTAYRIKLLQPSGRVKVLIMSAQGRILSTAKKSTDRKNAAKRKALRN